jgi:hypothetical protein
MQLANHGSRCTQAARVADGCQGDARVGLTSDMLWNGQLEDLKALEATRAAADMPTEDIKDCQAYRDFAARFCEVILGVKALHACALLTPDHVHAGRFERRKLFRTCLSVDPRLVCEVR